MIGVAVRRERVILDLQDDFTPGILRAAAATKLLERNAKSLDGAATRINRPLSDAARQSDRLAAATGTASRNVDGLSRSARQSESSINQLTGRLRVLADVAAVIGPSFVPIGGIAIPALSGLASQLGFAAIAAGTLVAAAQGVGDALKAVNEYALEPTAANLEKAREAMSKLGPDAQAFVARFQELRPVLSDIRDAAARGWFPGLTESLDSLEHIAPRVAAIFERIGEAGGNLITEGAAALAGPEWADFLRFVETNAPQALDELGRTVGNFTKGLANMWMAFDPLNDDFSTWLLKQSRAFTEWSEGLSETEGFQDFVDYIRENGPKVADAMGALGTALVEIVEAIAPLGGPSLKIIETFADVIGAIADSDLGTPIMAGVAALALYNRTLAVTTSLQQRLNAGGGLALVGVGRGTRPGPGGTGAFRGSATGLRTDLGAMAALWATAGARTERESARMSAAARSARGNLTGMTKAAGPAALALGALGAASSDAGEGLGATNAAMGALLGSMAGPWGVAAGATVGSILDIKEAVQSLNEVLESGDQRAASSSLQSRMDGLWNPLNQPSIIGSEAWSKVTTGQWASQRLAREAGDWGSAGSMVDAQARVESMRQAEAAEMGMSRATSELAKQLGLTNAEMRSGLAAIDARTQAALGAFDADIQWRNAMNAATEQAKKSNAGIEGNSKEAIANAEHLSALAAAWNNQREAMDASDASAKAINEKFKSARKIFIDAATAMGVPIEQARRLAKAYLAIPEKRATKIVVEAQSGLTMVNRIKAAIDALRDKKVTISVIRQAQGLAKQADVMDRWTGGFTGAGGKYEPAGITHRGEVVIPQELVRRDKSMLMSRYGHLPGMDELPGFASGGLATGRKAKGGHAAVLGDGVTGMQSLKGFIKALDESRDSLMDETAARRELAADLGKTVADMFLTPLGGASDVWSRGGGWSDILGVLAGDTAGANAQSSAISRLTSLGLDDPGALQALLSQTDAATLQNLAQSATADLVSQYEQQYQVRAQVTGALNNQVVAAQSAAMASAQAITNAELVKVNANLSALNGIQKNAPAATGKATAKANNKGASKASLNRRRG